MTPAEAALVAAAEVAAEHLSTLHYVIQGEEKCKAADALREAVAALRAEVRA